MTAISKSKQRYPISHKQTFILFVYAFKNTKLDFISLSLKYFVS